LSLIELVNATKEYKSTSEVVYGLDNLNITIEEGESVSIMGVSGAGKSTLMHTIGLLDQLTSGQYYFDGAEVSGLADDELSKIRNEKMGFVFQSFFLLPRTTALNNISLPLIYRGLSQPQAQEKAAVMMKKINISKLANRKPNELSGGQQQRVAIARALVVEPKLIMADEPTGSLDTKTSNEIMDLFATINLETGCTFIVVTHDPDIALQTKRTIKMRDGKILEEYWNES